MSLWPPSYFSVSLLLLVHHPTKTINRKYAFLICYSFWASNFSLTPPLFHNVVDKLQVRVFLQKSPAAFLCLSLNEKFYLQSSAFMHLTHQMVSDCPCRIILSSAISIVYCLYLYMELLQFCQLQNLQFCQFSFPYYTENILKRISKNLG